MRLAFVDLLFSWPPNGGADVDLYQVAGGLQRAGHEVRLFVVHEEGTWERGCVAPETFPLPLTRLDFPAGELTARGVCGRLKVAVDTWTPDAVLLCDGYFLKAPVALALAQYPLIARYYAYETVCHRDILRYKDGDICPNHYIRTPDLCRQCALAFHEPALRRMELNAWRTEYLAAEAFAPEYHALTKDALRRTHTAIVYNHTMQRLIEPYCGRAVVVPGGVDLAEFRHAPATPKLPGYTKSILMPGRGEDPAKGLAVLLEAAAKLREERGDFEIVATVPQDLCAEAGITAVGWVDRKELNALYGAADICVVPSVWEEPFGLVAVEAMACGRPVCASRTGGLQEIIAHGETGFLFDRGDSAELAAQLSLLLNNPALCAQMGAAGRARAEAQYTWDRIVARHYLPLLETLGAR